MRYVNCESFSIQGHVGLFTGTTPQKESRAEFFKLWFLFEITYIVWEWTSSLSGPANRRINREWQRFSLSNMQRKKGSKRIEMIIKMVNEFKLTVVHFARPNPMRICACAWIYRWTKNCGKSGLGRLLGLRAAGPSRGVGRGPAFSKTPFPLLVKHAQSLHT